MSWTRDKTSDQIRQTALAMAQKKAEKGCIPCVEAYLELARQHGASSKDVAEALAWSESARDRLPHA